MCIHTYYKYIHTYVPRCKLPADEHKTYGQKGVLFHPPRQRERLQERELLTYTWRASFTVIFFIFFFRFFFCDPHSLLPLSTGFVPEEYDKLWTRLNPSKSITSIFFQYRPSKKGFFPSNKPPRDGANAPFTISVIKIDSRWADNPKWVAFQYSQMCTYIFCNPIMCIIWWRLWNLYSNDRLQMSLCSYVICE